MVAAHRVHAALGILSIAVLAGCGGGGGGDSAPPPPPQFTIGGSVSGLVGSVVLQNNGGANLTVPANGNFTFTPTVTSGGAYAVAVLTPPELQSCTVTAGSGTANANVTNVSIACADVAPPALSLTLARTKTFLMQWAEVPTATRYRLLEDPTGSAEFAQVGNDLPAPRSSHPHIVGLHQRLNARYMLQACGATRCFDSNTVQVSGSLAEAIGYVKASNPAESDVFGAAIALSADGSTLAVSAPGEDSSATGPGGTQDDELAPNSGAVYVFARQDATSPWVQQTYLKASNTGADDQFGNALALSADGATLAVGAHGEDSNVTGSNRDQSNDAAPDSGSVYVFVRSAGAWTQQASLKPPNTGDGDLFGASVALSADGGRLAVGARHEDGGDTGTNPNPGDESAPDAGAVYVFFREVVADRFVWSTEAYIKPFNTGAEDEFGTSVALSADGLLLVVGAPFEDSSSRGLNGPNDEVAPNSGAAYLFRRQTAGWRQFGFLKAPNTGGGDNFGNVVALSADGVTLVIGAPNEASSTTGVNPPGNEFSAGAGAVYVYGQDQDGIVILDAFLKASNTQLIVPDQFGITVAVSADGSTIAAAAMNEDSLFVGLTDNRTDNDALQSGATYVFAKSAGQWSQQAFVKASNSESGDEFGKGLAISGDGQTIAVSALGEDGGATGVNGNQEDNSAGDSGAVYLY